MQMRRQKQVFKFSVKLKFKLKILLDNIKRIYIF
jgi:hypothetical protein